MTTAPIEHSTRMAMEERQKLIRSFGRLDMLLFLVCAIVGLDTLGQVAGYGAQTFTWVVVLGVFFLLPYGLVMAELGTAFPQEGGQYEWMKLAWGRLAAGMGAVLYWVSNPLWVGGSLAFVSTAAWSTYIHPIGTKTFGDYLFKLAFIWVDGVRRDHRAAQREVDPEPRGDCQDRGTGAVLRHGRHLCDRTWRSRLRRA